MVLSWAHRLDEVNYQQYVYGRSELHGVRQHDAKDDQRKHWSKSTGSEQVRARSRRDESKEKKLGEHGQSCKKAHAKAIVMDNGAIGLEPKAKERSSEVKFAPHNWEYCRRCGTLKPWKKPCEKCGHGKTHDRPKCKQAHIPEGKPCFEFSGVKNSKARLIREEDDKSKKAETEKDLAPMEIDELADGHSDSEGSLEDSLSNEHYLPPGVQSPCKSIVLQASVANGIVAEKPPLYVAELRASRLDDVNVSEGASGDSGTVVTDGYVNENMITRLQSTTDVIVEPLATEEAVKLATGQRIFITKRARIWVQLMLLACWAATLCQWVPAAKMEKGGDGNLDLPETPSWQSLAFEESASRRGQLDWLMVEQEALTRYMALEKWRHLCRGHTKLMWVVEHRNLFYLLGAPEARDEMCCRGIRMRSCSSWRRKSRRRANCKQVMRDIVCTTLQEAMRAQAVTKTSSRSNEPPARDVSKWQRTIKEPVKGSEVMNHKVQELASDAVGLQLQEQHAKWDHWQRDTAKLLIKDGVKQLTSECSTKHPNLLMQLLVLSHQGVMGHRHVGATMKAVQAVANWATMKDDVMKFLKGCRQCKWVDGEHLVLRPWAEQVVAMKPFEIIHVD